MYRQYRETNQNTEKNIAAHSFFHKKRLRLELEFDNIKMHCTTVKSIISVRKISHIYSKIFYNTVISLVSADYGFASTSYTWLLLCLLLDDFLCSSIK
jgi:hypothetical protein